MRKGNALSQSLAVRFNVQNPNDRPLPVRALHADVTVAGEAVASGDSDTPFVVPAKGDANFDMTIQTNLALIILKLSNKMDQHADGLNYELTGTASVDLPFVKTLPFHQSGVLPLRGR
jgi:LEA14-like dessication related protein